MKTIHAQELKKMLASDERITLVNTLAEEHFAKTKLPQAINIPQENDDFPQQVEQAAGGKDQTVVVYCASESCNSSDKGAEKLEQAGFTDVYDFAAGAEGWQQAGEKLQTASA